MECRGSDGGRVWPALLGEAEGKGKVGGEKERGTAFTWCKNVLKTTEEGMHVKRICTPKKIGGKPPKFNP